MLVQTISCLTCGIPFSSTHLSRKYCSRSCRPSAAKSLELPTPTVGAIAELAVCADLLSKGYAVFRAVSPACYCDLIAKRLQTVWEIEVRTCYERNGRFYFPTKYQEGVNCLALWNKETHMVTYLAPGVLTLLAM